MHAANAAEPPYLPFRGKPIILPAIDLRAGRVVRLVRGASDAQIDYATEPKTAARGWVEAGATCLHVIDLGGAFSEPDSRAVIRAIAAASGVPVQSGGGLRDPESVAELLEGGVSRVILGTRALEDAGFLAAVAQRWGAERVVLAMDIAGGRVKISGWTAASSLGLRDGLEYAHRHGIATLLVTAIDRDGTLSGPNLELIGETLELAGAGGLEIVVAGGIGDLEHIRSVLELRSPALAGVVVGRALYEGTVDLAAAVALAESYSR